MRKQYPLFLLPLLFGCFTGRVDRSQDVCTGIDSSPRFTAAEGSQLAGAYNLTLTSNWEHERGKTVRGSLELWMPDTLFQLYEPDYYSRRDTALRRIVVTDSITRWWKTGKWRPLVGAASIDLHKISVPQSKQLASRDPFEPGVRLEGANLQVEPVRLGYLRFDGNSMALRIERSNQYGFSGRWITSGFGEIVLNGRKVAYPGGTFCATRRADSLRTPPNTR